MDKKIISIENKKKPGRVESAASNSSEPVKTKKKKKKKDKKDDAKSAGGVYAFEGRAVKF